MIAASSHLGHDVCMPSSGAWVLVAACRCLGCEGRLLGSGSVCVSLGKGVRGVCGVWVVVASCRRVRVRLVGRKRESLRFSE